MTCSGSAALFSSVCDAILKAYSGLGVWRDFTAHIRLLTGVKIPPEYGARFVVGSA